jgi:ABC-2 type transport system ATP-binding protein
MIQIQNITKVYNAQIGEHNIAVQDLSLEIKQGSVLAYIGPNGSGKTTTFKMLLGLTKPTNGTITIDDLPPSDPASKRRMGYLPENPYFYSHLTGREMLRFTGDLHKMALTKQKKRISELLEQLNMTEAADRKMNAYSKGMLQRIGVAAAILHDPDIVLLDEPLSGLDPIGRSEIRNIVLTLKEQGKTIIFCSHILADVENICDEVATIVDGVFIEQLPVSEILKTQSLESYFIHTVETARNTPTS